MMKLEYLGYGEKTIWSAVIPDLTQDLVPTRNNEGTVLPEGRVHGLGRRTKDGWSSRRDGGPLTGNEVFICMTD